MKIKRIIKKYNKKIEKAANINDALNDMANAFAETVNMLASEISGYDINNGVQVALSAAFEVMSKRTEKTKKTDFRDFGKELKQVLVKGVKEAEKE